jgi:hypothetical protein
MLLFCLLLPIFVVDYRHLIPALHSLVSLDFDRFDEVLFPFDLIFKFLGHAYLRAHMTAFLDKSFESIRQLLSTLFAHPLVVRIIFVFDLKDESIRLGACLPLELFDPVDCP